MKKLLAIIAAVCCLLAVFAGCTTDNDPFNGGAGGNTQSEQVTDETQWKQAFADTMEARKSSGKLTIHGRMSTFDGERYSDTLTGGEAVRAFDKNNHIIYMKTMGTLVGNYQAGEQYFALRGEEIYRYGKSGLATEEDTGWAVYTTTYETEAAATAAFEKLLETYCSDAFTNNFALDVMTQKYSVEQNGEAKDLSEMFSAFTYDNATSVYSSTLYVGNVSGIISVDLKITFNGGKIDAYTADIIAKNGYNDSVLYDYRQVECSYGINLTVPQAT